MGPALQRGPFMILRVSRRPRLLQYAMGGIYVAIALFATTSIAIGLVAFAGEWLAFAPILLGFAGVMMLLGVSVLLIIDARIGIGVIDEEMEFILRLSELRARQAVVCECSPD